MKDTKYVMLFVGMVFLFNGEVGAVAHHVLFPRAELQPRYLQDPDLRNLIRTTEVFCSD